MSAPTNAVVVHDDRPVAVSVAVSTVAQLMARVVHLGTNVAISLALVRYFGPGRYGDYVFVVTVSSIFGLVSEFGTKNLAIRSISQTPGSAPEVLGTMVAARMLTGLVTAATAQAACLAFGVDRIVHVAVLVSSVLFFTDALLSVGIVFQVSLRQEYDALIRSSIEILELVIMIVLIRRSAGLVAIVAAPVAAAWAGVLLTFVIAGGRFGLALRVEWRTLPNLLAQAFPFALIGVAGVAYLKLDALVLAALRPSSDVGVYGAAFQPVENVLLTSIVLTNVLFPILAVSYVQDTARFRRVYQAGTEALVAAVAPVPVMLLVLASPLVDAVYEARYAGAVRPLQTLAFALLFMVVNVWQGFVLVAAGQQRVTLLYVSAAIVVNIVIDIVLVRRYGPEGAAIGTLATAVFLTACSTAAVHRLTASSLDLTRLARIAGPMAALGLAVFGLSTGMNLTWWVTILAGAAVWPVLLRISGLFSLRELRSLLRGPRTIGVGGVSV